MMDQNLRRWIRSWDMEQEAELANLEEASVPVRTHWQGAGKHQANMAPH